MDNLTTSNFQSARDFFNETVSRNDLYFSLALLYAAIGYFCYNRFWNKPASTRTEKFSDKLQVTASVSLDRCDLANIKVTKLLIHPIKSCRGTSVQEARYTEEGLEHDRKLAIIDAHTHKVLTAREYPRMVLIYPRIDLDKGDQFQGIHISFPADSGCEPFTVPLNPSNEILQTWKKVEDVELWGRNDIDGYICQPVDAEDHDAPTRMLSQYFGKDVLLVFKGPRPRPAPPTHDFPDLKATTLYQDGYPLLVTSEESLKDVESHLRGEVGNQGVADRWSSDNLVMERFRPNIVLGGAGVPWAEDTWETIRIGENSSTITLVSKCTRCLLPNVDPETGVRDKAVPYKVLMQFRTGLNPQRPGKSCFGCNGVPDGRGVIRVGDSITVVKIIQ
ncbi:hypothetical protein ACEPAI_281 [Sanghuangporus weigelae]